MAKCYLDIYKTDFFAQCIKDEAAKLKGINDTSSPKRGCCSRVVNYICSKWFFTPKCNIPKEQVESHDEEHFNFWNNLKIPTRHGKCGEKQQSLRYCNLDDDSENEINSTAKIRAEDSQADSSNSILTQAQYKAQLYNQSMNDPIKVSTELFSKAVKQGNKFHRSNRSVVLIKLKI